MARSASTLARFVSYLAAASPVAARTLRRGPSSAYASFECASEADAAALRLDIASAARHFGLKPTGSWSSADPLVMSGHNLDPANVDNPFDRDGDSTYSPAAGDQGYHYTPRDMESPGLLLIAAGADTTTRSSPTMPSTFSVTSAPKGSRLSYPILPRLSYSASTRLMPVDHMRIQRRASSTWSWCWTPWAPNRPQPTPQGADDVIRLMKSSHLSADDIEKLRNFFHDKYYSTWEKEFDKQCRSESMKNPLFAQINKKMDVIIARMDILEKGLQEVRASLTKKEVWGTLDVFGRNIDVPKTIFDSTDAPKTMFDAVVDFVRKLL